jgi:predicted metalloendopeptidase
MATAVPSALRPETPAPAGAKPPLRPKVNHPHSKHHRGHHHHHHHGPWGPGEWHEDPQWASGCWNYVYVFLFVAFIVLLIVLPLTLGYYNNDGSMRTHAEEQFASSGAGVLVVHGGGGGFQAGGMRIATKMHRSDVECGPGEEYNRTIAYCMPKVKVPQAMEDELLDRSVSPCDSFYKHACGRFLDWHSGQAGPADRSFSAAWHANWYTVQKLIMDAGTSSPTGGGGGRGPADAGELSPIQANMGALYRSCKDTLVDQKNAQETVLYQRNVLSTLLGMLTSTQDLPQVLGELMLRGYTAPLSVSVERHPTDASCARVLRFAADGFPDEHATEEYITQVFVEAGHYPHAAARQRGRTLSAFLLTLQQHQPNLFDSGYIEYLRGPQYRADMVTFLNVLNAARTGAASGTFDVRAMLAHMRLPVPKEYWPTWTQDLGYLRWLWSESGPLLASPVAVLRAYVEYSVLYHTEPLLPAMTGHHSSYRLLPVPNTKRAHVVRSGRPGTAATSPRDCVHVVQQQLPSHVAHEYMRLRGTAQMERIRTRVLNVTKRLVQQFAVQLENVAWLSDLDRHRALVKLKSIVIRIGHPTPSPMPSTGEHGAAAPGNMGEHGEPGPGNMGEHSTPAADAAGGAGEAWGQAELELHMSSDGYARNMDAVRAFRVHQNLQQWRDGGMHFFNRSALDVDEAYRDATTPFGVPLSMVNAFYDPTSNTITVPLGILQTPFYDDRFSDASVFATIGSVLGHELSHAFDPLGLLFDAHGTFYAKGLWSKAGMTEFTKRAAAIVAEYDAQDSSCPPLAPSLAPPKGGPETRGLHMGSRDPGYGDQTITEDMADSVGTRLAYEAFLAKHRATLQQQGGTEAEQVEIHVFFYAYAQMWCAVYSPESECNRLQHDVHAVPRMRVDSTLRHLSPFHEAFQCQEGSPMRAAVPARVY